MYNLVQNPLEAVMPVDIWHYPRTLLARQVMEMFASGLSTALVFFAPRRMGKTEFLRKDVTPCAEKQDWKVLYFSFLDAEHDPANEFAYALKKFVESMSILSKTKKLLTNVSKVGGGVAGVKAEVEFHENTKLQIDLKEVMKYLATKGKVLLLMDEVQILGQSVENASFVAMLRTALDMYKDNIKVIFTGSSQDGLRRMFSQAKAPFFHFGQNLPFPELGREFTEHLANVFHQITKRKLDNDALWFAFEEMQKVPQLIRALVERLALHPADKLEDIKKQLLTEIFSDRAFVNIWQQCSELERLLLIEISKLSNAVFGAKTRSQLAKQLGIKDLPLSTVQSAMRVLQRKTLIGRLPEHRSYCIEDPHFKQWVRSIITKS